MIYNEDLLFLHVPKTGGMALSDFLIEVLPRPVTYTLPVPVESITDRRVRQLTGRRHETLAEAAKVLTGDGLSLADFRVILAVIRNPYALEVSRYAYLRNGHPWDAGRNQDLAMHHSFDTFAVSSWDHAGAPIQDYFTLHGATPPNMRILRQETLSEDLGVLFDELGYRFSVNLSRKNVSRHDPYPRYYGPRAEEAVYQRYRWLFDNGYYPRLDVTGLSSVQDAHAMPLSGPVSEVGTALGVYGDGWAGAECRFSVVSHGAVEELVFSGWAGGDAEIFLEVKLPGCSAREPIPPNAPFRFRVPARLAVGDTAEISVSASNTWCPAHSGGVDRRSLSVKFENIHFQDAPPADAAAR
jgi:hypothetical protein